LPASALLRIGDAVPGYPEATLPRGESSDLARQIPGTAYREGAMSDYEIVSDSVYVGTAAPAPPEGFCRVYWGSHGCDLERGHVERDGTPHDCGCCECVNHPDPDPDNPGNAPSCVATAPYYGPETRFYGEDATPGAVDRWGKVLET
jgi:hypothetical protein